MSKREITLRAFRKSDAEEIQFLLNNEDVSRYLTSRIQYPYTKELAVWWVEEGCHLNPNWAIEVNSMLIGCVGIEPGVVDEAHTAEVGYWIGKPYWGGGYATTALQLVTENTFKVGKISRLTAGVFHPNEASMRVLEKCGYTLEGVFQNAYLKNGTYYNKHQYAKVHS